MWADWFDGLLSFVIQKSIRVFYLEVLSWQKHNSSWPKENVIENSSYWPWIEWRFGSSDWGVKSSFLTLFYVYMSLRQRSWWLRDKSWSQKRPNTTQSEVVVWPVLFFFLSVWLRKSASWHLSRCRWDSKAVDARFLLYCDFWYQVCLLLDMLSSLGALWGQLCHVGAVKINWRLSGGLRRLTTGRVAHECQRHGL